MSTHPHALNATVTALPLLGEPEDGSTGHRLTLTIPTGDGQFIDYDLVAWIDPDAGGLKVQIDTHGPGPHHVQVHLNDGLLFDGDPEQE